MCRIPIALDSNHNKKPVGQYILLDPELDAYHFLVVLCMTFEGGRISQMRVLVHHDCPPWAPLFFQLGHLLMKCSQLSEHCCSFAQKQ